MSPVNRIDFQTCKKDTIWELWRVQQEKYFCLDCLVAGRLMDSVNVTYETMDF